MLIEEIVNKQFSWVRHDQSTMESDFEEYKVKEESKWLERAHRIGLRFPIFDSFDQYKESIQKSPVVKMTDAFWNEVENLSKNDSIDEIENMVSSYTIPRNVQRIVDGIENGHNLPYPVILKGDDGYHIMSGNTRLNVARVLGAPTEAIIIDAR